MFTVHPLYPVSLNAAKNGWICIFIYDTFVIMCNKRNKINRQTAIWGRFSLIYLSDIDLIKITCNNGHFPMDMLEQDEIIDNLRRVELYWIYTTSIRSSHLLDTLEKHTAASFVS